VKLFLQTAGGGDGMGMLPTAGHRALTQPEDAGRGLCGRLLRDSTRSATRAESSSQTNCALRVLRCHGLSHAALQLVYRATVVARLTYAASAWRGLTKTSDRQRINSVTDRARRLAYCSPDLPTFDELCDIGDDELFGNFLTRMLYKNT